jgi:Kae1-associated kinase Bud32
MIGRLHNAGIIHGDLTTSNIIVSKKRIVFIDFGLGERSESLEERAVDLLLVKRAFHSAHYKYSKECLASLFKGYEKIMGHEISINVQKRLRDVERRGRYVSRKIAANKRPKCIEKT